MLKFISRLFKKPFPLTVVYIEAPESNGFIAHFEQFSDTYAQGSTKKEALSNLSNALRVVLELEEKQRNESKGEISEQKVTRESVKMHIA